MAFDIANALQPATFNPSGVMQAVQSNRLAQAQDTRAKAELAMKQQDFQNQLADRADVKQQGDAKSALATAQYVLQSQQPKALLQSLSQTNPKVAQFLDAATAHHGIDWNAATDQDIRGMAQTLIAHYGSQLGQGPPVSKTESVGPNASLVTVGQDASGNPTAAPLYTGPEAFTGAPTPMVLNGKPVMAVRGSAGTIRPIPGATPYQAPSQTENRPPAGYRLGKDGNLTFIPGGPADPARGKGGGTIADRMNPTMLASVKLDIAEVRNGLNQINSLTTDTAGAFFASEHAGALASIFHRAVTPEQQQNYDVYANRLAVAIASIQSMGRGQISDAKVAEARKLVPQPGDKHSTIKAKLGQINKIANLAEETLGKSGASLTNPVADAADESYGDTSGLRAPAGASVVSAPGWTVTKKP